MDLLRHIDRMIGFESDNPVAAKFGRERIKSVRSTIGVYYLAIIAPFLGIATVTWNHTSTRIVAGVLIAAVVLRFRHWVMPVSDEQSEALNPVAARMTGFMVTLLSCAQSYFYLSLALRSNGLPRPDMEWLQILSLGLLAALTQGAALTGILSLIHI